jgi:hypothetical protein
MSTPAAKKEETPSFKEVMAKASKSAVRGGTAGAVAMGANVACLMVSLFVLDVLDVSVNNA